MNILLTILLPSLLVLIFNVSLSSGNPFSSCPNVVDFSDVEYGGKIRQLKKADVQGHNLYYHRNPWNADNTYMIGVESDQEQKHGQVVLYDGNGCFIKTLYPIDQYDWRIVWDRSNPEVFYTWKTDTLYRYNVTTGNAELIKSFAGLNLRLRPNGPSLNQSGDRILVLTSDGIFHSYRLADMKDERSFKVAFPEGCNTDWEDERYIGYKNYIATQCWKLPRTDAQFAYIYDDNGELINRFAGMTFEHADFSPDGKVAYRKMSTGARGEGRAQVEIHVVNIDGSADRVVYRSSDAKHIQNLHVSWPDHVKDAFVVSFFPSANNLPQRYVPPLDEILLIRLSGKHTFLARTGTSIAGRNAFWAQPLASPSCDGSRISFNSNRSGVINQYILHVPPQVMHGTAE